MSKDNYFFYKGIPYKTDDYLRDRSTISGKSVWDNSWSYKVSKSDVRLCEENDIYNIFNENCKEAIRQNLLGWTSEKAKELEEKGKKYLTEKWKYYLLDCPNRVYRACQEGK